MTHEELSRYDGKEGRAAYVAYKGVVYDVSQSPMWEGGEHQGEHKAGVDLTRMMRYAPHGDEVFERFAVVGTLEESASPQRVAHETPTDKQKLQAWYQKYHPHPMISHFPIVLHFYAAGMDGIFLYSPDEFFEKSTFYAFFLATIFGVFAMASGIFSWWVNYNCSRIKPLLIKLYAATFSLVAGIAGIWIYFADATLVYEMSAAFVVYHLSVFLTVPAMVVLGYYGGQLTWSKKIKN
jgi:predicted heme/steroid binding protein/uncharacterized membrane protein